MATQLTHTATVTTTGLTTIAFASAPLGGFNAQSSLGTGSSLTVKLWVRTHANAGWLLADTHNLASGGTTTQNTPVYPPYAEARWEVTAIAGGNANLTAVGVGA